jgi:hypothetical protein
VRWNLSHFDLHFLYGEGCQIFLHLFWFFFGYSSFWELSVQFICPCRQTSHVLSHLWDLDLKSEW